MFKFLRKNKLASLITSLCLLLLSGAIIATVAWFEVTMQIIPDVDSGIILSYFESGDGSENDPFVITRPIHYYNLVRLTEVGYSEFDGNNTYFQFGKDLDSSGTAKFYNYNDSGVQQSGYSTTLNMNFYSGANALSPLGSASHPFLGQVNGNNLTVSNLHISGKDRTDIGVFGYVATGARVSNLYFDNVDIDLHTAKVNEINGLGHTGHSTFTTFGYIAGHVYDKNTFDNVYINNSSVRNSDSAGLPAAVKNNFGYIGYCDTVTLPNVGEEAYKQSFDAADVYNYLDANYDSISGHSLVTRNTEYSASGNLSTAISDNSDHYTFNSANSKNYSLATAGYQEQDHTYIAQYKNGNLYNMMTGSSVTQTAPEDQTTAGTYVYYDSTNSKWIYYTAVSSGSPVQNHYNVYYISYHGITAGTSSTTYYLKYDNGTLGYTTTAPTSYASTPDYYFAFATSIGSSGVSEIRDGTSNSYYIYSPSNEKYLYAPTGLTTTNRNTLNFGDAATIQSASCQQNMFAITGSSGTEISINYNGTGTKIAGYNYSGGYNDPKFRVTDGSNPAFTFTLHGDAQSSGNNSETTYSYVKTDSDWTPAANDEIAIVSTTYGVALSATQNTNNRGQTSVSITNDSFPSSDTVGRFKLGTNANYSGKFSLQDITPDGAEYGHYLCASGANSSNKLTSTASANAASNFFEITYNSVDATSVTRGELMYNHTNSVFACYNFSGQSGIYDIDVYLYESATVTIHYEGALDITESGESGTTIVTTPYDIYYYDEGIGTSSREQLTTTFVSSWSLAGGTTYVTLSPEIINGWNLVQSQADLVVGEKYIIAVYKDGSNNSVLKTAGNYDLANGRLSGITSTFNADGTQITNPGSGTYEFILNGNSSAGYTLSCSEGQLYADTTNTKLSFVDGNGLWSITVSSGTATITAKNTSHSIKYNSASTSFKTYTSGQTAVRLYRYDTTEPKYIGDKIGNGYNPNFIDTVGNVDYYSTYMRMNGSTTRAITEGADLNQKFYNTKYTSKSLVIRIPNRGSLDYGTLVIDCGTNVPVLMKNNSSSVTLASVGCTAKEADNKYHLYLNKYNIYELSYCTLNSSGNINGCYDTDGDEIFASGDIAEFVLILGAPTSTNVDITHLDVVFSAITGNLGDFGAVGFRSAPGTAPGEIFSFTYDLASAGYVYSSVSYNSATNTYELTFKASAAVTLYVYNYDANRAIVKVNNTRYYGPYNAIPIAASASPGSGGWTSY